VWKVLAPHSIRQFSLHFPSRASPCAITFHLGSNAGYTMFGVVWRVLDTTPFASFPFISPPMRHRVPSHFNWTLMLDTPCSKVVWRVLATHSIRQFPLHFPSRASPCAITFQLESKHGENEGQQLNCICQGTWRLSNQNALCICANRIVIFLKWGALDLYTLFLSADIVFSKKSQAGRILLNNVDLRFDTSKNNRSRGPFKTSRRLVYPNVKRVHQIQALYLVRRKLTLNLCDLPFGIKSPCLATNYSNSITKDRPFYDAIDPLLDLQFVYIC